MRLRKIWAEGSFSVLKREHCISRIRKRGILAATEECLLAAMALNLKRMAKCHLSLSPNLLFCWGHDGFQQFFCFCQQVLSRAVHEMLSEYPYADNAITADNSCLMIDTNPYDKDYNEMSFVEQQIFPQKEQDSLNGIKFMNTKLGFSDAVYRKMLQTSALMGRQSEENSKYRVSWTYHPDSGLEVMYEKK